MSRKKKDDPEPPDRRIIPECADRPLPQPKLRKKDIKALDRASKQIVSEIRALSPKYGAKRRPHGRPHGGRAIFKQQRIDALPIVGGPSTIADALGIARASLHQWCKRKKNPLPFVTEKDGSKLFRKDVIVKWLIATRRYRLKAEYSK